MTTPILTVDVAILGAGSAGLVARRQALSHGAKRVVLIEGGPWGTTCARVGCMPSKLLIAAGEAAAAVRAAPTFGVEAGPVRIDGAAVMQRVRRERDAFVGSVVDSIERIAEHERIRGWGRFLGPTRLAVDLEAGGVLEIEAKTIVIATGSAPWIPDNLRGLGSRLLTSDSVFELPTLPRSLAVIGVGAIGLELGQAFTQLGVETTILDLGSRMPMLASDGMQGLARELFAARLDLQLGAQALAAAESDDGVRLTWTDADGAAHERTVEVVLVATGRRPQLERLNLANAGVTLDDKLVPHGWDPRTTQIGKLPIFVAGDVTSDRPVLHEATVEGRFAGVNAARFPDVRAHVRGVAIAIVFTSPNIAVVGEIPDPDAGQGTIWEAGEVDYADQGRARVMAQNHGRVRIYGRRSDGVILGAELIAPGAEHLAHLLAWAIERRMTVPEALEMPYYHPVLEEGLRTAFQALGRRLKMAAKPRPLDCGPGV